MSKQSPNQQPLQKLSWTKKTADKMQWFKDNIDYRIAGSRFGGPQEAAKRTSNMQELYDVYNSKFPARWFSHITDPFSAKNEAHKKWPAKMRPANIISPTVNRLHGEYPQRPFDFRVSVKGDEGYNAFMEGQKQALYQNLSQLFINTVNQEGGLDTGVETKEVDMPEELMKKFVNNYKSLLSEQAQTDLDLILEDQKVKEKLLDMFKDWLVVGEGYSFKDVIRDQTIYEHVSPMELDYDKSPSVKYLEDGDWVVRRIPLSINDVVDRFYDSLKAQEIDQLEGGSFGNSPQSFADHLSSFDLLDGDKHFVYHVVWKSLEKIQELTYPDPVTGEPQTEIVDENYIPDTDAGETVKAYWVTQVLEGYRIGDSLYTEMKPVNYQPNQINNLSKHKLPYNGRSFSNTHSENTSIVKLGLPYQIMYTIIFFTLEKTLAKSRGKVALIDQNAIPHGKGWDEEKFFYWAEAQGYMLLNRNQVGVDKSFNQYQVLDLGLFDHISELIKLLDWCQVQYEKQIGITPQAKGQIAASESATGTNSAISQSSIITEMIFTGFDQLVRADLEGLLNCSQISNIKGKRAIYTNSDLRTKLLEINPDYYCYADMGIMLVDSAVESAQLARMRTYAQAFAQNGETPDAVLALETANNISTLRNKLREVKDEQQKLAAQQAESAEEAELNRIKLEQEFKEYENLLDIQKMHEEYDRKQDLVLTQGDINMAIESGVASLAGGDASDYMEQRNAAAADSRLKEKEVDRKVAADKAKSIIEQKKLEMKGREIKMKERVAAKQAQVRKAQAKKSK